MARLRASCRWHSRSTAARSRTGGTDGPVRPRRVSRTRPGAGLARRCRGDCTAPPASCRPAPGRRRRRRPPALCRSGRRSSAATADANGRAAPARRHGADRALETADAEQALVLRHGVAHRRMVDHDDAKQAALAGLVQHCGQPARLTVAKEAVGHEGRGGAGRRGADQRDVAAHAQIREGRAVDRRAWRRRRVIQRPQARQTLSNAPGT